MGVKAQPPGRRGVAIWCEHCARECVDVAYRLTAVPADLSGDALRKDQYFHFGCLKLWAAGMEER